MFSACETYEKQLRIEKTRLSHQVWSHGGSTLKKKRTLDGHFSRPAETDPYVKWVCDIDWDDQMTSGLQYLNVVESLFPGPRSSNYLFLLK